MQDKEFDQLFKDRFEEAEIMPSTDLWGKIEEQIKPERKRSFPVYWTAAATVVAVIAIGLIFNRPQKIKLYGTVAATDSQTVTPEKISGREENAGKVEVEQVKEKQEIGKEMESFAANRTTEENKAMDTDANAGLKEQNNSNLLVSSASIKISNSMQPDETIDRLPFKDALVKQHTTEVSKVTDQKTVPVVQENEDHSEAVVLASNDVLPLTKDEVLNDNEEADRRGIRNVGDLINYVVDKVDKREEKFIQFKTDDDDNSSLIGINIGMIRFSNRKHK